MRYTRILKAVGVITTFAAIVASGSDNNICSDRCRWNGEQFETRQGP